MAYKKKNTNQETIELILDIFKKSEKGFIQPSQIYKKTSLSKRQIRYALDKLVKNGLIVRIPNFNDLRSNLFKIRENTDIFETNKNQSLFDDMIGTGKTRFNYERTKRM